MNIITSLNAIAAPTAIALGNFDGIHRGHRQVIDPILATPFGVATVVSFHPHPQEWFTGQQRPLLTPLDEKADYLESIGVKQLVLLDFNAALAALSPKDFVEQILLGQLKAQWISVGQNFQFGHRRAGSISDLQTLASHYGVHVHVATLYRCEDGRISSSAIREALSQGDLERANRLLGRPYTMNGTVVYGQQLGSTLGFPTANLKIPDNKFCPQRGVYYVQVRCLDSSVLDRSMPGVMNLGIRPTVDGLTQTIEVHLLDWSGDLYGKNLAVQLECFLRPEQKFESLDTLKKQIEADCAIARSLAGTNSMV